MQQEHRDIVEPEILSTKEKILEMEKALEMAEKDIEKQTEANTTLEQQISEKEAHSEKLASDILDTKGTYLKARDDPIRLDKNNENIS